MTADDIGEFDESQGITVEIIRNYLTATLGLVCYRNDDGIELYRRPDEHHSGTMLWPSRLEFSWSGILGAARWYNKNKTITYQQLLRDMNPRWSATIPSQAALAHHKYWLCGERMPDGYIHIRTRLAIGIQDILNQGGLHGLNCLWWPCDENGNRVRWAELEGVMI